MLSGYYQILDHYQLKDVTKIFAPPAPPSQVIRKKTTKQKPSPGLASMVKELIYLWCHQERQVKKDNLNYERYNIFRVPFQSIQI